MGKSEIISCFFILQLAFLVMIVSITATTLAEYDDEHDVLRDMTTNLNQMTIQDIKVFNDKCGEGYEPAFEFKWEGTKRGCWCNDYHGSITTQEFEGYTKTSLSGSFVAGECEFGEPGYDDYYDLIERCYDIEPTPSDTFNAWGRYESEDRLVCVSRTQENL